MLNDQNCWGVDPFDNMPAQDLAFSLVVEEATHGSELIPAQDTNLDTCRRTIALASVANAANGYLDEVQGCPFVGRWLADNPVFSVDTETVEELAHRLKIIPQQSELHDYWRTQSKEFMQQWLVVLDRTAQRLGTVNQARMPAAKPITKKAIRSLLKAVDESHEPGYFCDGEYPQMSIHSDSCFTEFSHATKAIELSRFHGLWEFGVWQNSAADDQIMANPARLLLRGFHQDVWSLNFWCNSSENKSKLITDCLWELSNLPHLWLIDCQRVELTDDVIDAVARNAKLEIVRILHAPQLTVRTLESLSRCNRLDQINLTGCPGISLEMAEHYRQRHFSELKVFRVRH